MSRTLIFLFAKKIDNPIRYLGGTFEHIPPPTPYGGDLNRQICVSSYARKVAMGDDEASN